MGTISRCFFFSICACVIHGITGLKMTMIGTVERCPGLERSLFNMKHVKLERETKSESRMTGSFEVLEDIEAPITLRITMNKFVKGKWMYFYQVQYTNWCERIAEPGQFWSSFTQSTNMTSCPIKKGDYTVNFSSITLKSFNLKQLIGNYRTTTDFIKDGTVVACIRAYGKVE